MRAAAALLLSLAPVAVAAQDGAPPSDARAAIEARLAAMNPCEPLGSEIAGMSLDLGQVRSVRLRRADLHLDGDRVTLEAGCRLTCRGPGRPPGEDLSADIGVELSASLARCEIDRTAVDISDPGGEMAWALDLAAPVIEGLLAERIAEEARRACNDFAQ